MQTVPTKRIGLTKWSTRDLNPKLQLGSSILQQLCQLFHVQHHRIKIDKYYQIAITDSFKKSPIYTRDLILEVAYSSVPVYKVSKIRRRQLTG